MEMLNQMVIVYSFYKDNEINGKAITLFSFFLSDYKPLWIAFLSEILCHRGNSKKETSIEHAL